MAPTPTSSFLLVVLLSATAMATSVHAQDRALGIDDPVTSWGLSGLSDWDTAMPFLDIARNMRPFWGFTNETWEAMDAPTLAANGALDADGYPIRIPRGLTGIRTTWAWNLDYGARQRAGLYILTYQGRGTLSFGGSARIVSSTPGRIVFENTDGGGFWLDITAIDSGNHVRDISIVRADHAALAEAGAMFRPDWLALIADARELRFMDWMHTNNAPAVDWATRPRPADASWTAKGAPLEVMVRLANETGTDPWFTIPHTADEDYIRQFATYVRDHLDPRLKAHVELSNELWNASFEQFHWMREQAIANWGRRVSDDWETIFSYHTKRATEVALVWEDVFGGAAPDRLVNILGTQVGHTWLLDRQLVAPGWQKYEPDTYIDPTTVFEEIAATTYFGGSLMGQPDLRAELAARIRNSGNSAYSWIFERVAIKDGMEDAIPNVLEGLANQRAQADANGMRLVVYEGGQHMHHSFAVEGMTEQEAQSLGDFVAGFVRSPEMAALYADLWDGWQKVGQGSFMQFTETSAPSRWGSWGILAFPGDDTPRARFVTARQAEGGSWWGEGGGPQYLHGRTANGTEGADTLTGTPEEDFLAGLGGDDLFLASAGRDGINGGAGTDTFALPGPADAYTIAAEGAGYRVTGPVGTAETSTYLVHVEQITFGDGSTRALD